MNIRQVKGNHYNKKLFAWFYDIHMLTKQKPWMEYGGDAVYWVFLHVIEVLHDYCS